MSDVLTPDQASQFERDGYLILRAMVTPGETRVMLERTAADLAAAIAPIEYEADVGYEGAPASLTAVGGRTARRLRNAYQRAGCFHDWAENPQLLAILRQLLHEDVVLTLAHHNCVMTKHPDYGTATGWHRDIRYWSYARNELISVWLALGPEHAENGGLRVIPGSHRLQMAPEQMDDLDFLRPDLLQNQALFTQGISLNLQAGDVVLFHSGLFHAAGRNNSTAVKTSVVFAYRGVSNPPNAGSRSASAGEVSFQEV